MDLVNLSAVVPQTSAATEKVLLSTFNDKIVAARGKKYLLQLQVVLLGLL